MNQSRTDTSTKTNAELLLQIVSAERDCPNCSYVPLLEGGIIGFTLCEICNGTGKVPILDAGLMRLTCDVDGLCKDGVLQADDLPWGRLGNMHRRCLGRGWIPNSDAWAMKKALHQVRFQLREFSGFSGWGEDGYRAICESKEDELVGNRETVWDADPERARYLAVAGALEVL